MTRLRLLGGKVRRRGGKALLRESNLRPPQDSDLAFAPFSVTAPTDIEDDEVLAVASIANAPLFLAQGYTFSDWAITDGTLTHVALGTVVDTSGEQSVPILVDGVVSGDADSPQPRTVEISVDFAGPTSGTLSRTLQVGLESPPGEIVATFRLHNHDVSDDSPERYHIGLLFADGAVPSGSTITIHRADDDSQVPAVMDRPRSWASGALQWTGGLVINGDVDIPAGGSRLYNVKRQTGSRTPTPSGFDLRAHLLSVTSSTDMTIECTNMANSAGSAMTPATRTASLNAMLGTATRFDLLADHSRIQSWRVWGPLTGASAFVDGHQKAEIAGFALRDGSGDFIGTFYDADTAQDWWTQTGMTGSEVKDNRAFNLALKINGSTVQELFGDGVSAKCRLPAHSTIYFPERTGDNKGEMRWWAPSGSPDPRQPTLWCEYDVDGMKASKAIPEWLTDISPTRSLTEYDYNPGDNFDFRVDIDGAGAHNERGYATYADVFRLVKQAHQTHRCWLVSAFAGGHIPMHRASWHGVAASLGDIANQPIPFQLQDRATSKSASFVTGEVAGLGVAQLYTVPNSESPTITYTAGTGGSSVPLAAWVPGGHNDHLPQWGWLAAVLTGREIFRKMAIHTAFRSMWHVPGGCTKITHREGLTVGTGGSGEQAFGWAVRYSTPVPSDLQTRGLGFGMAAMSNGLLVCGDSEPIGAHLADIMEIRGNFEKHRVDQLASINHARYQMRKATGYRSGGQPTHVQGWEEAIYTSASIRAAIREPGNAGLVQAADYRASRLIKLAAHPTHPLKALGWIVPYFHSTLQRYNPPTTDYVQWDALTLTATRVNAGDTTMLDIQKSATSPPTGGIWRNNFPPTVGDVVFVNGYNAVEKPSTLAYATEYYIKELPNSASQMRLSATEGGAAINFGAHTTAFLIGCVEPQALAGVTNIYDPAISMGTYEMLDDYPLMCLGALYDSIRFDTIFGVTYATSGEIEDATVAARQMFDDALPTIQSRAALSGNFFPNWIMDRP